MYIYHTHHWKTDFELHYYLNSSTKYHGVCNKRTYSYTITSHYCQKICFATFIVALSIIFVNWQLIKNNLYAKFVKLALNSICYQNDISIKWHQIGSIRKVTRCGALTGSYFNHIRKYILIYSKPYFIMFHD